MLLSCAGCGVTPKVRQGAYTRHSPDAVAVSKHLSESSEFPINIAPTDTLCKSCYDMHLVILHQAGSTEPQNNLDSKIRTWKEMLNSENDTEYMYQQAVLATVVFVAEKLQKDRALLLPRAVAFFLANYSGTEDDTDLNHHRVVPNE